MEFRLLGPLVVESGGRDLTPTRPKQRTLLAALLLRANDLVASDELIEVLWAGTPPATAATALYGHVSALRKLLGNDVIETRPPGYVLQTEPASIDARRLELLLERARSEPEPHIRADLLRDALALFRGEALAEFRYEPFARDEAARLEALRLDALVARIDTDLEVARHGALVPELERLGVAHPYDERLRRALMLALYRSGRQADALAAYTETRALLVDDLGIEPSAELQRLERQILNQDPELEVPRTPRTASLRHTGLPAQLTSLVGREREVADVARRLENTRLLTLTGAAGTGKTRLSVAAAEAVRERFRDGAVFVELAAVTDPGLVSSTIAQTLGVRERPGVALVTTLEQTLADKTLLLVLDNCEHLLEGMSMLPSLLEAAPGLSVLATSRERLRVRNERSYAVPALGLEEAMELFIERAQVARPDFELDSANEAAVTEICRRLEGLPLAIELAAARTTLFPPAALLRRLGDRLAHSASGAPGSDRHRTLEAAISWSYDLLAAPRRRLFARLSVFAGGSTLESAEAVCNGDLDVIDGIASLLDKSLVRMEGTEEEPRFGMLETIREYAGRRLEESGEANELRRRHAAHFLDLAREAEPMLRGDPGGWLMRLEEEHDNLRAALDRVGAEQFSALAGSLWRFWYLKGHLAEGRRRLEHALALDERPTPTRAKALIGAAVMAVNLDDPPAARARAEEAVALHRRLGDEWGAAYSGFMLAAALAGEGELAAARELNERAVAEFRRLGDEHSALLTQRNLAGVHADLGDRERARELYEASLASARATGNKRIEASSLGRLSGYALEDGDLELAARLVRESVGLHRELGDLLDTGSDLCRAAHVVALLGDAATAARLLGSFDVVRDEVGARAAGLARLNDATFAQIRERLGDEELATALEDGRRLGTDAALALAGAALEDLLLANRASGS